MCVLSSPRGHRWHVTVECLSFLTPVIEESDTVLMFLDVCLASLHLLSERCH